MKSKCCNKVVVPAEGKFFCGGVEGCGKWCEVVEETLDEIPPIGVSQWRAHGEKYGYFDFFKEQIKKELIKEILESPNHDNWRLGYMTGASEARLEVLTEIEKEMPKVITPSTELPPNKLSQNGIFFLGQENMLIRVRELIEKLKKVGDR